MVGLQARRLEEGDAMVKKKGKHGDSPAQKPRQLRKQLRKAEAELHKAEAKRDRAQARVDAFGIITDEIRAQLADIERAAVRADVQSEASEPAVGGADGTSKSPSTVMAEAAADESAAASPRPRPRRSRKSRPTT
jgi:hypothetical protein